MTPHQKGVLEHLRAELARTGGVAPTIDEIGVSLDIKAKSAVHRALVALERQKKIVRERGRARSIRLLDDAPDLTNATDAALLAEVARRGLLEARHA